MIRVSMGFDEFKEELQKARLEGAQLTPQLIHQIRHAFEEWHSMDRNKWERAMRDIGITLTELEKLDFQEERVK